MKGFHLYLSYLLCCVLAILSLDVDASKKIRWLSFDFPPFEIISGPDAGEGMTDRMRMFTQAGLPEYEHQTPIIVNQARIERLFKGGLSCHAGMMPDDSNNAFLYNSIPYAMGYPFVFVTTKQKHKELFKGAESLSLSKALVELNASLTVPSRSLGPTIDNIIKDNRDNSHLSVRMSSTSAGSIFEMLIKDRTDYIITFSSEAIYWGRNGKLDQLAFIEIDELKGNFLTGGVGCSKTPEGKRIIETLNSYFIKNRNNEKFLKEAFLYWLPKELHVPFLTAYQKEVMLDFTSNVDEPPSLK